MHQSYLYCKLFPPSLIECRGHVHPRRTHTGRNVDLETVSSAPYEPDEGAIVLVSARDLHFTVGGLVESPAATAGSASRHPLPSQRCQGQPLPRPPEVPVLAASLPLTHVTTLLGEDTEGRRGSAPSHLGPLSYDKSFLNSFLFVPS